MKFTTGVSALALICALPLAGALAGADKLTDSRIQNPQAADPTPARPYATPNETSSYPRETGTGYGVSTNVHGQTQGSNTSTGYKPGAPVAGAEMGSARGPGEYTGQGSSQYPPTDEGLARPVPGQQRNYTGQGSSQYPATNEGLAREVPGQQRNFTGHGSSQYPRAEGQSGYGTSTNVPGVTQGSNAGGGATSSMERMHTTTDVDRSRATADDRTNAGRVGGRYGSHDQDQVRKAQMALSRAGADLPTDGRMGPETERAILNFQALHQLPITGRLDRETMRRLNAS